MLFHQQIFVNDSGTGNVLGRFEAVLDQLEHIVIGWKCKYHHHQAASSRCFNELIVRVRQVKQEITIKRGFALLVESYGGIKVGFGFVREYLHQEPDSRRWNLSGNHEIGAGKAEYGIQINWVQ